MDFLAARLDEKEAAAPEFHEAGVCAGCNDWDAGFDPGQCDCGYPARVLREVAAGRKLLAEIAPWMDGCEDEHWYSRGVGTQPPYEGSLLLQQILATVYSAHPDYDPAWALEPSNPDGGGS